MAALEGERDRLDEGVSALTETLNEYRDVVEDTAQARAIRDLGRSVKEDTRSLLEEDRLLRLGIVGQLKAGKSTLLNLLLFDGRDVLPKAATPMTAALTPIVKSDRNEIEVAYYSRKEWERIEQYAQEYRKTRDGNDAENEQAELRASHELVEMAAERGLQVEQYLGATKVTPVSMEKSESGTPRSRRGRGGDDSSGQDRHDSMQPRYPGLGHRRYSGPQRSHRFTLVGNHQAAPQVPRGVAAELRRPVHGQRGRRVPSRQDPQRRHPEAASGRQQIRQRPDRRIEGLSRGPTKSKGWDADAIDESCQKHNPAKARPGRHLNRRGG